MRSPEIVPLRKKMATHTPGSLRPTPQATAITPAIKEATRLVATNTFRRFRLSEIQPVKGFTTNIGTKLANAVIPTQEADSVSLKIM